MSEMFDGVVGYDRTNESFVESTEDCKCQNWAGNLHEILLAGHHPGCEKYDLIKGVLKLIEDLVKGIDCWAADEDGVHPDVWEAYSKARMVLGRPVRGDGK